MKWNIVNRQTVLGLALAMGVGCGNLDPTSVEDDGTGWAPMDEQTFQQLPVWEGTLELDVAYRSDIDYGPRTLGAQVTARNVGTTPLTGETSPRHWLYKAFETTDRIGEPAWSGWAWKGWDVAEVVDLGPGEAYTFIGGGLDDFPIQTLQPGTYYFIASLTLIDTEGGGKPTMRTPFFDAGEFELVR